MFVGNRSGGAWLEWLPASTSNALLPRWRPIVRVYVDCIKTNVLGGVTYVHMHAYLHAADRDLECEARSDGVDDNENSPVGFVTAFFACCSIACGGNAHKKKNSTNIRLAMAAFVEGARVDLSPRRSPSAVVVPRHIEWCFTDDGSSSNVVIAYSVLLATRC